MFLLPLPANAKEVDRDVQKTPPTGNNQAAAKSKASTKKRKTRADIGCPEELKKFQLK